MIISTLEITSLKELNSKLILFSSVHFSRSVVSDSLWPPWIGAYQAPLSMEFFRQEYWGGLPFPSPGDLPDPGFKPESFASPALVGSFFTTEPPGKPDNTYIHQIYDLMDTWDFMEPFWSCEWCLFSALMGAHKNLLLPHLCWWWKVDPY